MILLITSQKFKKVQNKIVSFYNIISYYSTTSNLKSENDTSQPKVSARSSISIEKKNTEDNTMMRQLKDDENYTYRHQIVYVNENVTYVEEDIEKLIAHYVEFISTLDKRCSHKIYLQCAGGFKGKRVTHIKHQEELTSFLKDLENLILKSDKLRFMNTKILTKPLKSVKKRCTDIVNQRYAFAATNISIDDKILKNMLDKKIKEKNPDYFQENSIKVVIETQVKNRDKLYIIPGTHLLNMNYYDFQNFLEKARSFKEDDKLAIKEKRKPKKLS